MPAAAPIPRGPTVLTLYTAADLLTAPGCPVCRYADEAGGRYLAWFALQAHADAATITRLCKSLGMCPRHTRGLMSQPGAAHRLTAVYRYVVEEALDRLSGRAASIDACPACEHDHGAVGRALDTLLDDLTDESVRERYRELGGLCIPHLATAAARGDQRAVAWLSDTMMAAVTARPPDPGRLAGTDYDVDARAVLRRAAAATTRPGPGSCIACLAAAHSQNDHLTWIVRTGGGSQPDRMLLLCGTHLGDVVAMAGQRDAPSLLAWQACCLDAAVSHGAASSARRKLGAPTSWVRPRRRADSADRCPACLVGQDAAGRAVDDLRASLRASHPAPCHQAPLCVRHLLGLQAADPWAGHVTARGAIQRAEMLLAELNEAFGKNTWARRHETRGPEMTAWRRAAAFLDGSVFCGCPPRDE
ncbi:MAG: hypothetical protein ACRDPY_24325 [Streptosporangiaceae bacterium]